jgi:hypothetical protein
MPEKFSIASSTAKLSARRRRDAVYRRRLLERRLAMCTPPLALRDDSRLAWGFLTRSGDAATMRSDTVVDNIATMQVLYRDTSYDSLLQNDMKKIAGYMKVCYPSVSWTNLWKVMVEHFIPICKIQAVISTESGRLEY